MNIIIYPRLDLSETILVKWAPDGGLRFEVSDNQ